MSPSTFPTQRGLGNHLAGLFGVCVDEEIRQQPSLSSDTDLLPPIKL